MDGAEHLRVDYNKYYKSESLTKLKFTKLDKDVYPSEVTYISPKPEIKPEAKTVSKKPVKAEPEKKLEDFLRQKTGEKLRSGKISEYLDTDSRLITEALDIITNRQADSNTISIIITALGSLGSEKAQETLINLAENSGNDPKIRFQAAMAFSQLKTPPIDSAVRFLMGGVRKFGTDYEERDIGSTSQLAAGPIPGHPTNE